MNSNQRFFVEAFKAWDPKGLAQACYRIVMEVDGLKFNETELLELEWRYRNFLDRFSAEWEGHHFELPRTEVAWEVSISPENRLVLSFFARSKGYSEEFKNLPNSNSEFSKTIFETQRRLNELGYLPEVIVDKGEVPISPILWRDSMPDRNSFSSALWSLENASGEFLERYVQGEQIEVWNELLGFGEKVRSEEVLPEAMAVLQEMMYRIRFNVGTLIPKLEKLGYSFQKDWPVFTPPPPDILSKIEILEKEVGVLPLSIGAWYNWVGAVDFCPDFDSEGGWSPGYRLYSEGGPDPLVVFPIEAVYPEQEDHGCFFLPFSPDDYHKDQTSGGGPYCLVAPCSSIDCDVEGELNHRTGFIQYMRLVFKGGGFSAWAYVSEKDQPEWLRYLRQDLLPF